MEEARQPLQVAEWCYIGSEKNKEESLVKIILQK